MSNSSLESLYSIFDYLSSPGWSVEPSRLSLDKVARLLSLPTGDLMCLRVYRTPYYSLDYEAEEHFISVPLSSHSKNSYIQLEAKECPVSSISLLNLWFYRITNHLPPSLLVRYKDLELNGHSYRLVFTKSEIATSSPLDEVFVFERVLYGVFNYVLLPLEASEKKELIDSLATNYCI